MSSDDTQHLAAMDSRTVAPMEPQPGSQMGIDCHHVPVSDDDISAARRYVGGTGAGDPCGLPYRAGRVRRRIIVPDKGAITCGGDLKSRAILVDAGEIEEVHPGVAPLRRGIS